MTSVVNRLILLVAIPIVSLTLLAYFGLSAFSKIQSGVDRLFEDRLIPIIQLKRVGDGYHEIASIINKTDNGILEPNTGLEQIETAQDQISVNWKSYRESVINTDAGRVEQISEFLIESDKLIAEVKGVLKPLGRDMTYDEYGETVIADYNGTLPEYIEPLAALISEIIEQKTELSRQDVDQSQELYVQSKLIFVVIGVVLAVVLSIMGFLVGRGISKPLLDLSESVEFAVKNRDLTVNLPHSGKDEIGLVASSFSHLFEQFREVIYDIRQTTDLLNGYSTNMTQNMSDVKNQLQVQLTETSHVSEVSQSMSLASEDINHNANQASKSVSDVNARILEGTTRLEATVATLASVQSQLTSFQEIIHQVAADSGQIANVSKVINDIAEQTNLLALNAAIEAARAGEQGRGFAVVADEVRSLAKRTQDSTGSIRDSIDRLQASANKAVAAMEESTDKMSHAFSHTDGTKEIMEAITQLVTEIQDLNSLNAEATDNQMRLTKDISENVSNIMGATQNSRSVTENVEQTVNSLVDAAGRLEASVTSFKTSKTS